MLIVVHAGRFSEARKESWGQGIAVALVRVGTSTGGWCTSVALTRPGKSVRKAHAYSFSKFGSACAHLH